MNSDQRADPSLATVAMTAAQLEQHVLERTATLLESNQQLRIEIQRLTDRENAMHESEEPYRMLFEQAAAGFALISVDGRFLSVNQKLSDMLGYSRDELQTKTWIDITHPDHLPSNLTGNKKMLSGDSPTFVIDKQYVRKNGSTVWVHLTASLVRAADGNPKYFVAVIEDITERRDAQERLARSEQRLRSVLDHTTACVYMKDPAGRYELINRRFEELFHISLDEIRGRTDFEIFPHDLAQALRTNDAKVLETRMPLELEETVLQDDGLHTYISIKVPILDASGNAVSVCGISTDISERKQAESELVRAKESAEQASRIKSQFLANISHEIRTPIMALLGAAERIHTGGLSSQETSDHSEIVLRSGRHLLSMVDDLFDQSRIDTGRLDVAFGPCCLPEMMADVHAVTAPLLKKPVTLEIKYESEVPEYVTTDRKRLTQAVINLVHNAIKFTHQGSIQVKVSAEFVDHSPFLSIAVEDTGEGIGDADLNRIFEPFTQLKTGLGHHSGGMGLGLPLARSIAHRLGGTLDVRSQLGQGSLFVVRIPIGPLDNRPWIAPEAASHWNLSQRYELTPQIALTGAILIAEDSEDVRRLLIGALQQTGANVVGVEDGRLAIEAMKTAHFDLVLLDLRMPRVDGFEAAKAIREMGYAGPLIALTASTTQTEHKRILAAGFDELWSKPIPLRTLISLCASYLHSTSDLTTPSGGLEAKFQEVRSEYADRLRHRIEALQTAFDQGDFASAREILHQLIGSAGIVGFAELSRQACVVHDQLKRGAMSPESSALQQLYAMARQISG